MLRGSQVCSALHFFRCAQKTRSGLTATRSAALSHFGPRAKAASPPQLAAFIWAKGPFSARLGQLFWPSDVEQWPRGPDQGGFAAAGPSE
ncbi:hypothetical protein SGRA_2173 [Saprospira grandis str. Lewin]|uniref:Uncharacterized protein n=1 Tax=Saprospira grandis (strain Lewin) TaxID=984262 RepID=H6L375_SAPGL|nr:hypothetical protein SGRA_2173 [Saprospira grandis str. Lewin]